MNTIINKLSGIFAKESFLIFTVLATLLFYGINLYAKLTCSLYSLFIIDCVFFICVIFLFIAYRNHNKNVQKGLLGAILMWYLYDEINYVIGNIIFNDEVFTQYDTASGHAYIILSIITMILFAALFMNHFIINSDHHSRPINIFVNQLLVIVIAIISLVSMCLQFDTFHGSLSGCLEAASWHTGLAGLVLMIAAYESRFDAYKIRRETACKGDGSKPSAL